MKLAESTWLQVEAFDRSAPVLIPVGSLCARGPHLPLSTATLIAESVASLAESGASDSCLLMPALALSNCDLSASIPGTVALSASAVVEAVRSCCEPLQSAGFWKFVVWCAEPQACEACITGLRAHRAQHPQARLAYIEPRDLPSEASAEDWLPGGRAETSLVLALRPEWVQAFESWSPLRPTPDIPGLIVDSSEISEHGLLGNPAGATADFGELLLRRLAGGLAGALRSLRQGYAMVQSR